MLIDDEVNMVSKTTRKLPAGKTVNASFTHRVLIVDDDPSALFAFRKLIEKEGFGVDICECLGEVVDQIGRVPYLAVIADLRSAGKDKVDGLELLLNIRIRSEQTKVIIVSAHDNDEIEQTAIATGAAYYFEKPVSPLAILDLLNSYV